MDPMTSLFLIQNNLQLKYIVKVIARLGETTSAQDAIVQTANHPIPKESLEVPSMAFYVLKTFLSTA